MRNRRYRQILQFNGNDASPILTLALLTHRAGENSFVCKELIRNKKLL